MYKQAFKHLCVDLGSSHIKVALIDSNNKILLLLQESYLVHRKPPIVQFDLNEMHEKTLNLINQTLSLHPDTHNIGLTGQRSTVAFWNQENILYPAISWEDLRAQHKANEFSSHQDFFLKTTGLPVSAHYSAFKIQWAIQHIKSIKKAYMSRALFLGPLVTYFIYQLSNKQSYFIDHTHAQRTLLFNIHSLCWDTKLCQWFNISPDVLPFIQATRFNFGHYAFNGKSYPITASIGDTQAAVLSVPLKQGNAMIQLGSGAFLCTHLNKSKNQNTGLLQSVLHSNKRKTHFILEGTINAAGTFLDAFKSIEFKLLKYPQTVLIPALNGLASPFWDSNIKPTHLSKTKTKPSIQDAIDGLASLIQTILSRMSKFKKIKTIFVSGGLSHNQELLSSIAKHTGLKLLIDQNKQATLLGLKLLMNQNKPSGSHKIFSHKSAPNLNHSFQRAVCFVRQSQNISIAKSLFKERLQTKPTLFLAHRGANTVHLENTMEAFLHAQKNGADGIECDLQLSQDNQVVVFHDPNTKRLSRQNLIINQSTYKNLSNLNLHQYRKIPLLKDVLSSLNKNFLIYLEIKEKSTHPLLWLNTLKIVQSFKALDRVCFCSFNIDGALKFKHQFSKALVGGIFHNTFNQDLFHSPLDILSFHRSKIDENLLSECWLNRKMVFAWTVNSHHEALKFESMGLDAIVSDCILKTPTH